MSIGNPRVYCQRLALYLLAMLAALGGVGCAARERPGDLRYRQTPSPADRYPAPLLLSRAMIWHAARHNAFGDLIHWRGAWYACCREGSSHTSIDGQVRILRSSDFQSWTSAAVLRGQSGLRDAHFAVTPNGELLLNTVEVSDAVRGRCRSVLFRNKDGLTWSGPVPYGDPNVWIWRIRQHAGSMFGVGYSTDIEQRFIRLYRSNDNGITWAALSDPVTTGYPNETELVFDRSGALGLLIRRDSDGSGYPTTALWVTSLPPYNQWLSRDLGTRFASPCVVQLPDGRKLAAGRFSSPNRIALAWLDDAAPTLVECLPLAEERDIGYPGMVLYAGSFFLVYHVDDGKGAMIYSAKVRVPKSGSVSGVPH